MKLEEWQEEQLIKKARTQVERLVRNRTGGKGLEAVDDKTRSDITAQIDDMTEGLLGWFYRGRRKVGDRDPKAARGGGKPDTAKLAMARELIAAVEHELARGLKHFTKDGRELKTVLEVIEHINTHGEVLLEMPNKASSYLARFGVEGNVRATKTNHQR